MNSNNEKLSLFSKETLDSIALSEINGGEASNTYCAGAKCKDCQQYVCDTKAYKCTSQVYDPILLPEPLQPVDPTPICLG